MKKYTRVTYAQRCQISILLQAEKSIIEIAKLVQLHRSTVYRELTRNSVFAGIYNKKYLPIKAQALARKNFKKCKRKLKVQGQLETFVRTFLQFRWSPEQIAGRLNHEGFKLGHQTIYRFTKAYPEFKKCLHYQGKRWPGQRAYTGRSTWKKSIHERPRKCNERLRIGDWERDTMFVKDRRAILVCTDRKSRYVKLSPLEKLCQSEVAEKTVELLKEAQLPYHTITNDNGSEFSSSKNLGCDVYFCDPKRPDQRGTVENTIGVLRRIIKSDTAIETIENKKVEAWMNLRPRKVLDYKTPLEVFYGLTVALAMEN